MSHLSFSSGLILCLGNFVGLGDESKMTIRRIIPFTVDPIHNFRASIIYQDKLRRTICRLLIGEYILMTSKYSLHRARNQLKKRSYGYKSGYVTDLKIDKKSVPHRVYALMVESLFLEERGHVLEKRKTFNLVPLT